MRVRAPTLAAPVFALLAGMTYVLFPDYLGLATQIFVLATFALSYDLLQGHEGIVSLGHAAFFGLGAYTAATVARWGVTDPLAGLLAAAAIGAAVALVLAPIVVRGNDFTRLLITLGIGSLLFEAANRAQGLTGGANGLADFEIGPLLGMFRFDFMGRTAFFYAFGVLAVVYAFLLRVTASPFGLALAGIRKNVRRMSGIGAPVGRHLAIAYTLSGCIVGLGGAVLARTSHFVSLDMLGFDRSAQVMMVATLGGTGQMHGVVIGAVVFGTVRDALSTISPQHWNLGLGIVLIASVLTLRGGFAGALDRLLRRAGMAR